MSRCWSWAVTANRARLSTRRRKLPLRFRGCPAARVEWDICRGIRTAYLQRNIRLAVAVEIGGDQIPAADARVWWRRGITNDRPKRAIAISMQNLHETARAITHSPCDVDKSIAIEISDGATLRRGDGVLCNAGGDDECALAIAEQDRVSVSISERNGDVRNSVAVEISDVDVVAGREKIAPRERAA
jgi:hypothetical protein